MGHSSRSVLQHWVNPLRRTGRWKCSVSNCVISTDYYEGCRLKRGPRRSPHFSGTRRDGETDPTIRDLAGIISETLTLLSSSLFCSIVFCSPPSWLSYVSFCARIVIVRYDQRRRKLGQFLHNHSDNICRVIPLALAAISSPSLRPNLTQPVFIVYKPPFLQTSKLSCPTTTTRLKLSPMAFGNHQ